MSDEREVLERLGYDRLEGRRIVAVQLMTPIEAEDYGWDVSLGDLPVVLVLDDGTKVVPCRDPEENGPGFLAIEDAGGYEPSCDDVSRPAHR